jgi:hypothetical protein
MMTMTKRIISAIFFLLLPFAAYTQDDDFGIWYGANGKLGITDRLDAGLSVVLRTFGNGAKIEQGYLETGLDYKLTDFLSAGASYRLTDALEDDSQYHLQHKVFIDVKGNLKAGLFTFQGRFRFQTRFRTYFEYVEDKIPDYTARVRVKATFKIPSFPLDPYLYFETFIPLNKDPEKFIGKNRFAAGMEYQISKSHSIEAGYIFQRDYQPDISDINIISLSYNFKF